MSGINKVIILGRLGQDPELKAVGNSTVCRLNVATSESWTDKNGQKQERTEWHRIVVWGKLAEICAKYLSKGSQVYVEGKNQTRSWEDQGVKKYSTEIVVNKVEFLSSNKNSSGKSSMQESEPDFDNGATDPAMDDFGPFESDSSGNSDDGIPF